MTAHHTTEHHSRALVRKTGVLTLADLVRMQATGAPNSKRPTSLSLHAIEFTSGVFQWRLANEDIQADEKHVRDLARAITRTDNPEPLDPILMMAIGDKYFVVDGHHRVDAYLTAKWIGGVPVEYFEGSLDDATIRALDCNKKNKLPLSDEAKLEAAWKLLGRGMADATGQYTQAKLSEVTTVSLRTVKRMAAVLKKHGDVVSVLTWAEARRKERDAEFKSDDGWKEKKARKLAKQFMKCGVLTKDPEITAMALVMVSSRLPKMLVGEWSRDAASATLETLRETDPEVAMQLEAAIEAQWEL